MAAITPESGTPTRTPRPNPAKETQVGGFSWRDSTFLFYSMVNSVLKPTSVVLDLGAGRGAQIETPSPYKRQLLTIQGKVQKIIGIDVDDAVLENPIVDQAHVVRPTERLPFESATFDVIFSDWVLEHVDNPEFFAGEVHRVLKPGGWFLARTVNRWGPVALASSAIPNSLHKKVLARLQPGRKSIDVFPTRYRLNTKGLIAKHFPRDKFVDCSTYMNTEVAYLVERPIIFAVTEAIVKRLPSCLYPVLIVAVRKRD